MTVAETHPHLTRSPAPGVRVALKPFCLHPGMVNGAHFKPS